MENITAVNDFSSLESLYRLGLALGVGLFIGLEREWRGKEAGLRTFGFTALLCALGGMLGESYGLLAVALTAVLIIFLNWQSIRSDQGAELTTSAALLVTALTGVLCGLGHKITPAAVAVVTAGLLAWKERLAVFSHKLTAAELRSAILLAVLTFAIYPALPTSAIDPWGLIIPRAAWMTVILIAAIGFVNYMLWKIFWRKRNRAHWLLRWSRQQHRGRGRTCHQRRSLRRATQRCGLPRRPPRYGRDGFKKWNCHCGLEHSSAPLSGFSTRFDLDHVRCVCFDK